MTSMIDTTRSSLQTSISSVGGQFVAFICNESGASVSPYKDNDSGSSISSSMVAERKSRSRGDEYASCIVPEDATTDILLLI